jgi:hypothetical protein
MDKNGTTMNTIPNHTMKSQGETDEHDNREGAHFRRFGQIIWATDVAGAVVLKMPTRRMT